MLELPGIVLAELGRLPSLETITLHPPGPEEVLVRIAASGICHTDLGYVQYARACPVILGHEGAGMVEEVGERVQHVKPGDHVAIIGRTAFPVLMLGGLSPRVRARWMR